MPRGAGLPGDADARSSASSTPSGTSPRCAARTSQIAFAGGERESDAAAAAVVAHGLEDAYFHVGRKLDLYPGERIPVVLYPSEDFHDVTQTPSWTGGVYDGRIKLPSRGCRGRRQRGARAARCATSTATSLVNQLSRGRCPVWLNEGVAIWCEEERDGERDDWALADASPARCSSACATSRARSPACRADRVHVAYAQSYLAVRALVDRPARRRVRELLDRARRRRELRRAPSATSTTRDLAGFENELLRELTG